MLGKLGKKRKLDSSASDSSASENPEKRLQEIDGRLFWVPLDRELSIQDDKQLQKDEYVELLDDYFDSTGNKEFDTITKAGTILQLYAIMSAEGGGWELVESSNNMTKLQRPLSKYKDQPKFYLFLKYVGHFEIDGKIKLIEENLVRKVRRQQFIRVKKEDLPKFKCRLSNKDAFDRFWNDLSNYPPPCTANDNDKTCENQKVDMITGECLEDDVIINGNRTTLPDLAECYNKSTVDDLNPLLDPFSRERFIPYETNIKNIVARLLSYSA